MQPVYLIKGDDPSIVNRAVSRLLGELVEDRPADLTVQELPEDATVGDILDAALTPAFLTDRRVVVVRSAGRFKATDVEPLVAYVDAPVDSTALVLVGGGGALPQRLTKGIKARGHIIDVTVPSGKARAGWLKEQVQSGPVKVDRDAQALLADHLGDEMGALPGTLDALAAAYGEGAKIGIDQLTPFLGAGGSATPWQFTDAIDAGNTEEALSALRRLLGPGQRHPLAVLATLVRHFGNLLRLDGGDITSEADAARRLGMAPFPAKKALAQSRRLGSAAIARGVLLVTQAELDLKGASSWPGELVLDVLVARLTKLAPTTRSGRGALRSARS